jgi:hypothetical protein
MQPADDGFEIILMINGDEGGAKQCGLEFGVFEGTKIIVWEWLESGRCPV